MPLSPKPLKPPPVSPQVSLPAAAALTLSGILLWQLMEYLIHRFLFHAHTVSYVGITLHFLFHGCHHKYPMDRERLVFPPVPAAVVVAGVYKLMHALLPPPAALALFAGWGLGYVAYDCLHYAVHSGRPVSSAFLVRDLKRLHMQHHYKDDSKGYGISTPLYDVVFNTLGRGAL